MSMPPQKKVRRTGTRGARCRPSAVLWRLRCLVCGSALLLGLAVVVAVVLVALMVVVVVQEKAVRPRYFFLLVAVRICCVGFFRSNCAVAL